MVTDDERREVAARLRELRPGACFDDVYEALGAYGPSPYESRGLSATEFARLLADLIEPPCDRDALRALADEMEAGPRRERCPVAPDCSECTGHCSERLSEYYARRIREACGVVEE